MILRFLKISLVAAIVGASLAVAAFAHAAEPQAEIRVRVIHARTGQKKFDPKLDDLKKFLTPYSYNTYTQVIDETLKLGMKDDNNTQALGLLSGKNLNVTLTGLTADKATIHLKLVGQTGQMLDTEIKAGPHKLFFIAGPRFDDGVLFIAIEPHYDPAALDPAVTDAKGVIAPAPGKSK